MMDRIPTIFQTNEPGIRLMVMIRTMAISIGTMILVTIMLWPADKVIRPTWTTSSRNMDGHSFAE